MAEGLFNYYASSNPGIKNLGLQARSAGTLNMQRSSATEEANAVMKAKGIDISEHISNPLSMEICEWADVILVMEGQHKIYFTEHFPEHVQKVNLLTEYVGETGDVDDPMGYGVETYRKCRDQLEFLINKLFEKQTNS